MAEFKLERFKYNWRGDWVTGTAYKRDDVVRVGGKSYVCIITHAASANFRDDLDAILPGSVPPQALPRWTVMTNGFSFVGDWATGTEYNLGDIVKYNGSLWLCSTNHLSSAFATQIDNWTTFSQTTTFLGNHTGSTSYTVGSVVRNNGNLYRCTTAHISQGSIDLLNFEIYLEGIEWKGNHAEGVSYEINDLVKYGGSVYRCTGSHTSSTTLDIDNFKLEVLGSQYDGLWAQDINYSVGDIVQHQGYMYYAVNNNVNSKPFVDSDAGSIDWILLAKNISFQGAWQLNGIYKTGDVVLRGGNLYIALRDIGGITVAPDEFSDPVLISGELLDGSTLDYLEEGTWELLIPGKSWKGQWREGTYYSLGDIIIWQGSAMVCNTEHTASFVNFPGPDNGSGYDYWDMLVQAGQPAALSFKGDILTYGLNRQLDNDGSTVFDDSSFGDANLLIGTTEQILSITSDLEVYWRNIQEDAQTFFVATNGIDDVNRGTFQNPFRTIRYAVEYVEDNFTALTPTIIRVATGKYEEIAPIVVPAGCAVNGDELRSTTVLANSPLAAYQNDYPYVTNYLTHFVSILTNILSGTQITPQTGNTKTQVFEKIEPQIDPNSGNPVLDADNNPVLIDNFPASNQAAADIIVALIADWKNYVEFNALSGEISPTLAGSNILNSNQTIRNAAEVLRLNQEFLQYEILAYLQNTYPAVTFDEIKVKNDVESFIRGFKRDITYSGNYATLLSAKRYANAITGSQNDNLFYMRDTTGLRDMTTGGLGGVLNPPGVFELYQKPTGGALVSLDPGWGPDDSRTWITRRSPYIQGLTNTGTGCVGMKVDGALHNGGNRSMTANDFTQVLSDGIGAWITNNARAELVSVFTYYCQIGYFAEDGGIIRAANGNNSYGKYGSIADGTDDTEIPQVVAAFNRNNEAVVSEAFAGGANDELFAFEYANAGEEYTTASATILGAGANASVEYTDFRDGGVFEARLTSPDGSSKAGGAGYLRRQGNAQETLDASSTIKLAATETIQFFSEVNGMRVTITGGTGVGQYGYISGYDFSSKNLTVKRDSDNALGWEHIIPGTPLVAAFDLTTRYRIEPRITFAPPAFTSSSSNLFTNRTYVDMAFGATTETYTGISFGGNVIWRDDNEIRVKVKALISDIAIQFTGEFATSPTVPFQIEGRTSGATATVTAISANTGQVIETDLNSGGSNFQVGEEINLILTAGTGNTFDGVASPAIFSVTRTGTVYNLTLTSAGSGYSPGNKITVLGTALGGSTPANDLTITVNTVSDDSTSSILTYSSVGTGRGGRFVSLTNIQNARWSDNGTDWSEVDLPFNATMTSLTAGNNRFIATATASNKLASSLTGVTWSEITLPLSANWSDSVYGNGKFVIIASDDDRVITSNNGTTWTVAGSIPNDTDGGVDSTTSVWSSITYGNGKYVAISSSDGATASSTDGITWTRHDSAITFNPSYIEYGNNRFVAISAADGETAHSFDGITWYTSSTTLTALGSIVENGGTAFIPSQIKYDNGIFLVIGTVDSANTDVAFTSEDGIFWTQRVMPTFQVWSVTSYGNNQWVVKANAASTNALAIIGTGARAKGRAEVDVGAMSEIRLFDPGSGYNEGSPPSITVTDPNATFDAAIESRVGNKVLSQPDFVNRGAGYRSTTSTITITGDGFADIIPVSNSFTISGVTSVPSPGVQIQITGVVDPDALEPGTLAIFSGVSVTDLGDDGTGNETKLVQFQISPRLDVEYVVPHGTQVTLREKFSQCRLSGHDFLDIGTGNFIQTNYPTIYAGGAFFTAAPENEVYETNNGRVFYVSTDQDGNFRTGELFSVQQATGVVTISAEFFDLDGLSELALGGVRLGGSGTVVSEFSTDPTFAADSNNVIPTQRAIATFLADRLSVGGESLEVNRLRAGQVILGGDTNEISSNNEKYVKIPVPVNFDGTFTSNDGAGTITTNQTEVSGTIVSQVLFLRPLDETMQ